MPADSPVPKSPDPQSSTEKESSHEPPRSPTHPAERDDRVETEPVDSPEQNVLTLDDDDYR
jgi:hypothetical protein